MEKVFIVRNAGRLTPKKKGCGFKFIHLALEAIVEDLKKKAIELFFPYSVNYFGNKFTDTGYNIVPVKMSTKDYQHKKGLYLSRTYFVMYSRYRRLLDLDLLNSFQREDFEPAIVFHQPTNLEPGSSENAVSQSH